LGFVESPADDKEFTHIILEKNLQKGVQKEKTPLRLLCFILVHSIFELLFGEQDG
jgi:hypothetical protein